MTVVIESLLYWGLNYIKFKHLVAKIDQVFVSQWFTQFPLYASEVPGHVPMGAGVDASCYLEKVGSILWHNINEFVN